MSVLGCARKKALALCIKSTTADEFGSNGSGGDAAAAISALPTQVATISMGWTCSSSSTASTCST
jgi:hypothetical protein